MGRFDLVRDEAELLRAGNWVRRRGQLQEALVVLFPTMTFALFFVVVLGVSWKLNDRPVEWKWFVLAASYFFYGWADWRFCFLLAGSTLGNWWFAGAVHRARDDVTRKRWMLGAVGLNLVVLGFFKYYGFFIDSVLGMLEPLGLAATPLLIKVALPVGISFFTFCAISYVIDVFRRDQEPVQLLDFAVYLSFFPHLVAGPIVRVSEFVPQLQHRPDGRTIDVTRAVRLICRGMFKKVVIANYLATAIVDPVFVAPGQHTNWELLVGAWGYAVQIYADFSGYTDIAIGIALLMGVRFPDNFDQPYSSRTIQEFWRRWHMTLSRWLRDYLYIPLGGNRGGPRAEYRNLFLTMLLGGLWHGASWTFVIWGAYHGVGLALERRHAVRADELHEAAARGGPGSSPPAGTSAPATRRGGGGRGGGGGGGSGGRPGARWLDTLGLRSAAPTSSDDPPARPAVPVSAEDERLSRLLGATEDETQVMTREELTREHAVVAPRRTMNPWLARLWVFHFVVVGWIFFRATSLGLAVEYLVSLVTNWGVGTLVTPVVLLAIGVGMVGQFVPRRLGDSLEYRASLLPPVVQAIGVGLFLLAINLLGPQGVAPFIYFDF
jgi:alginate O-acetyltransferase complex protein AlgI